MTDGLLCCHDYSLRDASTHSGDNVCPGTQKSSTLPLYPENIPVLIPRDIEIDGENRISTLGALMARGAGTGTVRVRRRAISVRTVHGGHR